MTDLGPAVLEAVHRTLQVDESWTAREERGFRWWAYRHAQHVWAEAPVMSYGEEVTLVRAETNVLRAVPNSPATEEAIALLNASSTMSGLIHHRDEGRVTAHCSAYFHPGNPWLKRIFSSAALLQLLEAEGQARDLAERLGGEPDTTVHPSAGTRWEPDDMLNAGGLFAGAGQERSPFTEDDLEALTDMEFGPWVAALRDAGGLSCEVGEGTGMTPARLSLSIVDEHPFLGSGVLMVLRSDAAAGLEESAGIANELNRREARMGIDAHFLGAWCGGVGGLSFRTFLPALLASSEPPEGRQALLFNLSAGLVRRVHWVGEQLGKAA